MWPLGEPLRQFFQRFMDERDTGVAVVSNIYLLVGVALPLWLLPLRTFNKGEQSQRCLLSRLRNFFFSSSRLA